jgi:hypothetical protein
MFALSFYIIVFLNILSIPEVSWKYKISSRVSCGVQFDLDVVFVRIWLDLNQLENHRVAGAPILFEFYSPDHECDTSSLLFELPGLLLRLLSFYGGVFESNTFKILII